MGHDGESIRASLATPETFARIFEAHYRVIDAYCVRRLGGEGHDVSAATFTEAFRVRHRFDADRDDARIARQQALLRAIGSQLRARIGSDPGRVRALVNRVFTSLTVEERMSRDTVEAFATRLVRPGRFAPVTAPTEPDPSAPGRLRLLDRPAGSDFLTWAVRAAGATGREDTPTQGSTPPPAGASC